MVTLTLNNGITINVEETSTTSAIIMKGDLTTVSTALSEITTDNLKNADLNGTILVNKVYTGFSGQRDGDEFMATFSMRDKTDVEIINERLDEQDAALIELAESI